jgi:HupE / UreJ protein
MRGKTTAVMAAGILLFAQAAFAHRIDEYLQATVFSLQANRVQASMRLIPGIAVAPSVIAEIDSNGDGVFSESEERAYAQRVLGDLSITSDGKSAPPKLLSWSFPPPAEMRDGVGEIHIEYSVDLPSGGSARTFILSNHHLNPKSVYLMNVVVPQDRGIRIAAQKRNEQQSIYEIDYQETSALIAAPKSIWGRSRVWLNGLQISAMFRLGMRHIAEGTDHLLFLLVLLLPAPLLTSGSRWGPPADRRLGLLRILGIVTAFTVGHSLTLGLAAFGFVHVPERPVEVLIALSILVTAVHALRPIFPGREAWIAAFFGLIHGLAFAATLDRLGLARWERVAGVLAFNLGIETMQMIVVAVTLPSLMLMSRTRVYSTVRIGGAVFAGIASMGWIIERLTEPETFVDAIINRLARHAQWIAVALFLMSVACRLWTGFRPWQPRQAPATTGV